MSVYVIFVYTQFDKNTLIKAKTFSDWWCHFLEKSSVAKRKKDAIRNKYGIAGNADDIRDYTDEQFFKVYRYILETDTPIGSNIRGLKMADIGLYFLLNSISREVKDQKCARIMLGDSETIKNNIMDIMGKKSKDTRSSQYIRESFKRLADLSLIRADIVPEKNFDVYKNIKIPYTHDKYTKNGFFKFYIVDMSDFMDKIKDSNIELSIREFLELLGVYTVSFLTFYSEKSTPYLGNGVVTLDYTMPTKYANRIDFTFGLKLTGGIRKKGMKEYLDMLEELGLVVSTPIDYEGNRSYVYTFLKNVSQFFKIIDDIYEK